jgi:N-sulfoglucosamine sulfohydrolase
MTIENKLKRSFTGIVGFPFLIPGLFAESALKKPNLIVFIADDLGWEDFEPYGNNQIITPNISSLARQGCRFDKVFLTASSSSPGRASILTSLYPSETGAAELHQPLSSSSILATTPLRDIGYYTESDGKWHLGKVKSQWDKVSNAMDHQMGDAWVNAIRKMPQDKSFFLWEAAYDPHRGYNEITPKVHDPEALTLPSYLPDLPIVRRDYADYYNEITRFDEHIGMDV